MQRRTKKMYQMYDVYQNGLKMTFFIHVENRNNFIMNAKNNI
jgi:hypothetical protein